MGNRPFKKKLRKNELETNDSNFSNLRYLPNEILLKIFDHLHIGDLLRCAQTCRRLRLAVHDNFLWKKVNLSNRPIVPDKLIKWIFEHGCEYLSISDQIAGHLMLNETTKLKCLNLARRQEKLANKKFSGTTDILLTLLRSCTVLEELELYCVNFTGSRTFSIQGVKTLKVLRLSYCKSGGYKNRQPLELDFIKQMIDQCLELEELSLYKTFLSEDSIDYLVKNITPKVSKLSLCTSHWDTKVFDKQIEVLVNRCNNLTELSLTGPGFTNDSVNFIIKNLHSTLLKLCLIKTSVSLMKLCELKAMKKLTVLDFYSMAPVKVNIVELETFRRINPHIQLCYAMTILDKPKWSSDNLSTYRRY